MCAWFSDAIDEVSVSKGCATPYHEEANTTILKIKDKKRKRRKKKSKKMKNQQKSYYNLTTRGGFREGGGVYTTPKESKVPFLSREFSVKQCRNRALNYRTTPPPLGKMKCPLSAPLYTEMSTD
jgi:hypothetical protein